MTGILLLFVAVIWFFIALWLTKLITQKLPQKWWSFPVRTLLFAALLPLPLADEIVGGRQFEQLCKENSTVQVDRLKAVGKTIVLADLPDVEIKGKWVRIVLKPWRYVDLITGETVVSYNTLMADGGRFIQILGISEGGVPLTFKGSCEPSGLVDPFKLFEDIGINFDAHNRPTKNIEKIK